MNNRQIEWQIVGSLLQWVSRFYHFELLPCNKVIVFLSIYNCLSAKRASDTTTTITKRKIFVRWNDIVGMSLSLVK